MSPPHRSFAAGVAGSRRSPHPRRQFPRPPPSGRLTGGNGRVTLGPIVAPEPPGRRKSGALPSRAAASPGIRPHQEQQR